MSAALLYVLAFAIEARAGLKTTNASTVITDRFGRPLRSYSNGLMAAECIPLKLQEISPWLTLATITVEDKRFFSHHGVDLRSAARALSQNIQRGHTVSGASTITQQLVRAMEPRRRGILGKISEIFSALHLETDHTKEEILEAYFNDVPYGPRLIGAGAAAVDYFGLPASDLSPAQAALLAGIPKSPVNYDPRKHLSVAIERQRMILRRMVDLKLIDEETYRLALAEKITVRKKELFFTAPHFADQAIRRGISNTTLDSRIQDIAARALSNQLSLLSGSNHVKNGAVIVVENANGDVLAWVGSNDFFDQIYGGQVDGVIALRQPGSALKPFLYTLALSKGAKASDLLEDSPLFVKGGHSPSNYDKTFHGLIRLREALACSYNIPAIRVAQKVGIQALLSELHDFGFTSLNKSADYYGEGLALGNGEVSLLELANAYATLARGGIWLPVRFGSMESILAKRVMGRSEAYIVTDILSDNSARSPAFGSDSAFHLPFDLAAKTGTTKDYRDNWAVGYTPEWTIGVWVGNFDGSPMRRVSGITGAAPILKEVSLEMKKLYGSTPFHRPPGVRTAKICPLSGLPVSPFCPSSIDELFLPKDVLAGQCKEHDPVQGSLATEHKEKIDFPKEGDIFRIDPQSPMASQAIFFKTSSKKEVRWAIDGETLQESGPSVNWSLVPGHHQVSLMIVNKEKVNKADQISFTVVE